MSIEKRRMTRRRRIATMGLLSLLVAGEYTAPTFEFIFPENVMRGDGVVPNDLWHLPFLRNGEGPGGAGPLEPAPW